MHLVMNEGSEGVPLAGQRHQQHRGVSSAALGKENTATAWCGVGAYEIFQRSGPMEAGVWGKKMRGFDPELWAAVRTLTMPTAPGALGSYKLLQLLAFAVGATGSVKIH